MANGPLTPPPTTATELQDEARNTDAPASQVLTPTNQTSAQDGVYLRIFSEISALATRSKYEDLIHIAENGDLNSEGDRHIARLLVTTPLVLAYLILDKVPSARFALTRLPDNLTITPIVKALMGLVASTWERKYAVVYARAEALFNIVTQPDFFDVDLTTIAAEMTTAFVESFRRRTCALISKAYASLPVSLAQTYLGLPFDQLLTAAEKIGWSYDASAQILTPCLKDAFTQNTANTAFSSLTTFNFVADSVARLEM